MMSICAARNSSGLGSCSPRLGVAVITYRRRVSLERLIDRIASLTRSRYELVVADDGGGDDVEAWCNARSLRCVTGENRGVAWNKNRGLFALATMSCDPLLLIEDDTYPVAEGWEKDWIEGTRRWHHLAFQHPRVARHCVSGSGTPSDPFVNPAATAPCLSVSAEVFHKVGYFDSRFVGYGHEHSDWTTRIKRAGYGYREIVLPDGRRPKAQLYLSGGLVLEDLPSAFNEEQLTANRQLQFASEPVFRRPWRTDDERSTFLAEQAAAGFDIDELDRRLSER